MPDAKDKLESYFIKVVLKECFGANH